MADTVELLDDDLEVRTGPDPDDGDEPGDGAAAPDAGDKGGDPAPDERYAALEASIAEMRDMNARLLEMVSRPAPEPVKPAAPAVVVDDAPEALADAIGKKGVAALFERGVPTIQQVEALVAKVARETATEVVNSVVNRSSQGSAVMGEFPELRDKSSELFRRTHEIFQADVVADPSLNNNPVALRMAARAARAELAQAEATRQQRINRQSGPAGSGGRGTPDGGANVIDDETAHVLRAMKVKPDVFQRHRSATARRTR